jgi:hypothetical protein
MFSERFLLGFPKWKFMVDEQLFPHQRHVRLRGLNAFVVYRPEASPYFGGENYNFSGFVIQAPNAKSFYQLSDKADTKVIVDQLAIPPIRIGRILTRTAVPYQEIYGANVLRNVSPMGEWTIELAPPEPTKDNFKDFYDYFKAAYQVLSKIIDDILIDLEVVGKFKA